MFHFDIIVRPRSNAERQGRAFLSRSGQLFALGNKKKNQETSPPAS